ncbi:hypothetical protein [Paenarthrobacter sp. NPDC018779]|uniref:hypothetical protein n=1 Tax=Paenarthrobacter sp. NPDC018779 TaxID=3364375 RepID=UPI0037C9E304
MITNAHIMSEYFKTGHVFGRHSTPFKLENFADEYKGYITQGTIHPGTGKHRLTRDDYVLAAGQAA